jgi:hypothetical protein
MESQTKQRISRDRKMSPVTRRGMYVIYIVKLYRKQKVKKGIFCDITPYSPLKVNRLLGEKYLLHLRAEE